VPVAIVHVLAARIIAPIDYKVKALNEDALNLVRTDRIVSAVVKLRSARRFVVGDLLGVLDGAPVLQVSGDAGGAKRMTA
jgi:hypothetical protein